MAQTKEIVGCCKTAVKKEIRSTFWLGPGQKPPYTVKEMRSHFAAPTTSIFTSYKIFEIEYDKSESSEKIWKCPHCNEEVKVINKKAGSLPQKELENLSEEYDKPRRKLRIILPIIFLILLGYCIINPGTGNSSWGLFLFCATPALGICYLFFAVKRNKIEEEYKFGFTYIENPNTHNFLVSQGSEMIDFSEGLISYESKQQPITPESDLSNVQKIVHDNQVMG